MQEISWSAVFRAITFKRIINTFQNLASLVISKLLKKGIVWGAPSVLTIEPTVRCNLRCPQCITGMGKIKRDSVYFDVTTYENILDQIGDQIWYLLLFNQGEPFLHKKFLNLIKIAKKRNIYITTSTNGHFLYDDHYVNELVNSGLDTIIISLDGADEKSYAEYRSGGDFKKVISGINNIVRIKKILSSKTPKIFLQFLVMQHNENQVNEMKQLATKLQVDRLLLKTFQIESAEQGIKFLPNNLKWRRYKLKNEKIKLKNSAARNCSRLWYSSVILSDNRVAPCCFDKNGKFSFGMLSDKVTINQIWNSNDYNKFRSNILQGRGQFNICQNCSQNQEIYI